MAFESARSGPLFPGAVFLMFDPMLVLSESYWLSNLLEYLNDTCGVCHAYSVVPVAPPRRMFDSGENGVRQHLGPRSSAGPELRSRPCSTFSGAVVSLIAPLKNLTFE